MGELYQFPRVIETNVIAIKQTKSVHQAADTVQCALLKCELVNIILIHLILYYMLHKFPQQLSEEISVECYSDCVYLLN